MRERISGAPCAVRALASRAGLVLGLLCLCTLLPALPPPSAKPLHLKVIASPYEPFAFERDGAPAGLDVDLLTLVCQANGWSYELEWMPFAEIFDHLAKGQADVAIGAFYDTPERRTAFPCSRPYLTTGLVIVSRPVRPIQTPDELEGLRVGVKELATGQEWARRRLQEGARFVVVPFPNTSQSFDALVRGDVDAVLNDSINSAYLIAEKYPGQAVLARGLLGPRHLKHNGLTFLFRPGGEKIRDTFDATLAEFKEGGVLDRLLWTWVQTEPDLETRTVVLALLAVLSVVGVFVAFFWLRQRRLREKFLGESERHYRGLVEEAPLGVLLLRRGRVTYANRAAGDLLSVSSEGLQDRRLVDLVDPQAREAVQAALADPLSCRALDTVFLRDQAKPFPAHLTLRALADAAGESMLLFFEDTTDVSTAKLALHESAERERLWVQHGGDMVLVHDLDGRYLQCLGTEWLGYKQEDLIGKYPREVRAPQAGREVEERVQRVVATGRPEVAEVSDTLQGREIYFSEFTAPVQDATGRIRSVVRICRHITPQREAETALRESERRLSTLLANLPGMAFRFRLTEGWPMEYASQGARDLTGHTPDSFVGESRVRWEDLVHPEDRAKRRSEIEQAVATARPYRVSYRIITASGQVRWILAQGRPVMGSSGSPEAVEGFATDITTRVRTEEALRRSEEHYRLLVENQTDLVVKLDLGGHLLFASPSCCELFGKTEGELLGESLVPHVHEDDRDASRRTLADLAHPPHAAYSEQRTFTRHGWRWIAWSFRAVLDETGLPGHLIGIGRDITAQRAISEALSESEVRFRTLAETTTAAILIFQDDRLAYANRAAAALTGRPWAEMAHLSVWEAFHPQDVEQVRKRVLEPGSADPGPFEARVVRRGGGLRFVQCTAGAVQFGGRPAGILTAFDVTERIRAEEAVRESESRYRTTIDSLTDAVHVVDRELRIVLFNATFREWAQEFGNGNHIVGRTPFEIFPFLPEKVREEYMRVFATGQPLVTEESVGLEGRVVFTETRKIPVLMEGRVSRVLTVIRDVTPRKHAEAALRASEARYRQIFEGISEGIYVSTPEGRPLLSNPALVRMLGYESEEEIRKRDIEREGYSDLAERQRFKDLMERDGFVRDHVSRWLRKDGTEIDVVENARAVRNDAGEIVAYEGTVRDVTEQRRAEQALRESEARLLTILEQSPLSMALVSLDGRIDYLNRKAVETTGYTLDDIPTLDHWWRKAFPDPAYREEVRSRWTDLVRTALEEGREIERREYRVTCADGSERVSLIFGVPVAGKIFVASVDVSDRVRAEQALKESESRLRRILDHSPIGMVIVGPDGTFEYANKKFVEDFGYSLEEAPDLPSWALRAYPDEAYREASRITWERLVAEAYAENREIRGGEYQVTCKHGSVRTVYIFGVPLGDRIVAMLLDVTEREQALAALRESEARLRQVFENSYDAIFLADATTGKLLDANRRAEELIGRPLDEIREMNQMELHPPEERERYRAIFEAHQGPKSGQSTFDLLVQHKDGRRIPVDISGSAFEIGERSLQIGVFHDITNRKAAETDLRRFKFMVDHAGDEVYLVRPDGSLAYTNEAAARSLGYTLEELYALGIPGIDSEYGPRYAEHFARLREEPLPPFETTHLAKDGRRIPKEIHSVHLVVGGEEFAYGSGRDISERKAAEQLLRESEARYRIVAEQTGQLVYDYDIQTGEIRWSGAILPLTGYLPEEFRCDIGGWEERIHKEDREAVVAARDRATSEMGYFRAEYRFRQKNGSFLPLEERGLCLAGPDGRAVRMLGTLSDLTERKRALAAVQTANARLQHLLASTSTVLYSCRPEGDFGATYVSENVRRLLSLSPEQFTVESSFWASRIHPEDSQRVFDNLGAIFETGSHNHQYRFLDGDGRWRWMRDEIRLIRNEQGRPVEMVGSWTDITELVAAEEALKRSERDYRGLFENAHDAIVIFEPEGEIILDANPSACALYGVPREELVGASLETFSMDPDRAKPKIQQTLAVGALVGFETRHRRADGTAVTLEVNAATVEFQGRQAILSIHRDVTDRRAAEEAVRRSQERLQLILDRTPLACILWDTQFRATLWNPAAEKLFGYSVSQALGRHPYELVVPPERKDLVGERMARLIRGDESAGGESVNFTASGKRILTEWHNTILKEPDGEIVGILSIVRDITARRAAEEQILKRNRQLSALLASTRAMTGFLDLPASAKAICEAAISAFDLRMVWVGLVVPEDTEVHILASAGFDEGYTEELHVRWDESDRAQGPAGRCIKTRMPVVSLLDDPSFAPWREAALRRGYRAIYALPLVHEDTVRGTMCLYSANPEAFDAETADVLQIFARQCTMVVVNASLYEETRRTVEQLLKNQPAD